MKRLRTLDDLRDRARRARRRHRSASTTRSTPDGPLAAALRVHRRRRRRAARSATGSPSCPWRAGTATADGRPTDLVRRRWRRFGASGAKLVWGGEAVAVRADGRANPNQLVIDAGDRRRTRRRCAPSWSTRTSPHSAAPTTWSSGCSSPTPAGSPARRRARSRRIAYRHPVLDARVGAGDDATCSPTTSSTSSSSAYVDAAVLAAEAGFDFVDVKHCHGYLCHELLERASTGPAATAATSRTAPRSCAPVVERHPRPRARPRRSACGCRRSTSCRSQPGADGVGVPEPAPTAVPLRVRRRRHRARRRPHRGPRASSTCWRELGIGLVCITAGSPYYNPHVQRPASFPPSDGYRRPRTRSSAWPGRSRRPPSWHAPIPTLAVVGVGLLVPAGVAAPRRAARGAHGRRGDRSGIGRMAAQLPGAARRRPRRPAAASADCCAARSATARPRPATAWSRAATRSTTSTRSGRSASNWPRSRRRRATAPPGDDRTRPVLDHVPRAARRRGARGGRARRRRRHRVGRRPPRTARRRARDRRPGRPLPRRRDRGRVLRLVPRGGARRTTTVPSRPCSTRPRRSVRRWSGSGPSSA